MSVLLYPRAVSHAAHEDQPTSLRVWTGVFDHTSAPTLTWFLEGEEITGPEPVALRPLQSVRSDDMRPSADTLAGKDWRRAFTGVYEFTKLKSGALLEPDTPYTIKVKANGEKAVELITRTLPAAVPATLDEWFNVLLVSCFHQAEDRHGLAGIIVNGIRARHKPQLTLLLGDQVYLDLPTLQNFPDDLAWLADKFELDYRRNWEGTDGYAQVLAVAPHAAVPDDHEYWNNYPHAATFIPNTWKERGRQQWAEAAIAMYEGFQLPAPAKLGEPAVIDVHPLSFFIADTRSRQHPEMKHALAPEALQQMETWIKRVAEKKMFGVFVAGQSLFVEQPGRVMGQYGDYELPNYHDFNRILQLIEKLAEAGRPLLCITGDVHWGRVLSARDRRSAREAIYEIISSPASLVTMVPVLGGPLASLQGLFNTWPRHSEAGDPFFNHDALRGRFAATSVKHRQTGNHVTLLSFRQTGGGLELRIKYWPIHSTEKYRKPFDVEPLYLSRIL